MPTTETMTGLPHWDMTVVFPSLDSPEFHEAFGRVRAGIAALGELFDQQGIAGGPPLPAGALPKAAFDTVLGRFNDLLDETHTLGAYIASFVSTDSRDAEAQARYSEFQQAIVPLMQLSTRLTAWIGRLDVDALIAQSAVARDHAFVLQKAHEKARHLMAADEEALTAELSVTGSTAWEKLHGDVTSQLSVPIELHGEQQELPMSMVRNLASDADRDVRRRAYEAELAVWERTAVPLAAALNSIKGEVNTLARRRHWDSPLDEALFENHIDRATLDAMMAAARESFPDFRRYLRAKARALHLPALAFYDLFAPLGASDRVWSWDQGTQFVADQFGTYSPRLRDFALRAFRERWVDAEPRPGKSDGAFCMSVRKDESRVLTNYKPAFDGVSTLAHELGHGYHNLNLAGRTQLQRDTPMTLAETASIFCETIIRHAALKDADPGEQLLILEAALQDSGQIVVDISSRFLFEQSVFEARLKRELSSDEFCALMLDAQRQTYGDGLDPAALHPYMWAVKSHYYSTASFYNFPYMFCLLFGLGLYAQYQANAEEFKQSYDALLSSTGLADAATLAGRFGIDVRAPDFWRASLAIIRADIDLFEKLTTGAG